MKYTVDFSDVQSGGAIPAGQYPGVIANALLKEKPGSEHPYINWDVVIAEGEHDGRHQFMTTSFTPAALWKMMETFQNLGYQEQGYELEFDDQTGQLTNPEVIGLPCTIEVFQEPYNNRMTSKISTILGPNGESAGAATEAEPEPATKAASRPATKATPAAAAKNGPAPAAAAKRSPFPAAAAKRTFK